MRDVQVDDVQWFSLEMVICEYRIGGRHYPKEQIFTSIRLCWPPLKLLEKSKAKRAVDGVGVALTTQ